MIADFSSVVTTTNLPSSVTEVILAAGIEALQEVKSLRQYGFVDNSQLNDGAKNYIYNTYDEMTDAYDRAELEDFRYDAAGATEGTASFVELDKGFSLSFKADHLKKISIKAAQTKQAVRKVIDREDAKIAAALIASGALTSTVTATAVLSGTSADPVKDLAQAKRKCKALGYNIDKTGGLLFIEDVNLEEMLSIIASNPWYATTADLIRTGQTDMFMGLKIVSLPAGKLTHGTAVIMKSGITFNVGVSENMTTKIFDDEENHTTKVQVYESIVPVVVRPDAGALLTGW